MFRLYNSRKRPKTVLYAQSFKCLAQEIDRDDAIPYQYIGNVRKMERYACIADRSFGSRNGEFAKTVLVIVLYLSTESILVIVMQKYKLL